MIWITDNTTLDELQTWIIEQKIELRLFRLGGEHKDFCAVIRSEDEFDFDEASWEVTGRAPTMLGAIRNAIRAFQASSHNLVEE